MRFKKMLSCILAISMTAGSLLEIAPLSAQAAGNDTQDQQANIVSGGHIRGTAQRFPVFLHRRMRMSMM